jgi:CheY-like chemotaxis protein
MDQTPHEVSIKTRIYLVEDERLVAQDLREILESHGYQVIGNATSGTEAIEEIKQLHPDVVIMDVRIEGELNGIEVAIIVQSHFQKPVPVVFLTGFSEQTFDYLKVIEDYIYINKPFKEHILIAAVQRALEKVAKRTKDQ